MAVLPQTQKMRLNLLVVVNADFLVPSTVSDKQ